MRGGRQVLDGESPVSRSGGLGFLCLLLLSGGGCLSEQSLVEGPLPERVVPEQLVEHTTTAVEIQGRGFLPDATVSHRAGAEPGLDLGFQLILETEVPLQDIVWQSTTLLIATVPDTLAVGIYDLRVMGPDGRESTLADALTISPDPCPDLFYLDADGDGFGDPTDALDVCPAPPDRVIDDTDCDDADTDNWSSCASCVDRDGDSLFWNCDRYVQRQGPDCDDDSPGSVADGTSCFDGDRCTDEELCTADRCLGVNECRTVCSATCQNGCGGPGCCVPSQPCAGGACDTCSDGCSCDQSCDGGGSCNLICEAGTRCRLESDGTDDVTLDCQGGDCTLRCQDADSCSLDCPAPGRCLLDCNGASTCDFGCAAPLGCGFGVRVCNRDCP